MTYSSYKATCAAIEKMYGLAAGEGWKYIHTLTIFDAPIIDFQPLYRNSQIKFVGTGEETSFNGFVMRMPRLNDDMYNKVRARFIPIENVVAVTFLNKTDINSICEIVHKQFDISITPSIKFMHSEYSYDDFHELYGELPKEIYTSLPCEIRLKFFKTEAERDAATKDTQGIKVQLPGTYYVKAFVLGSDDFVTSAICTVHVLH